MGALVAHLEECVPFIKGAVQNQKYVSWPLPRVLFIHVDAFFSGGVSVEMSAFSQK